MARVAYPALLCLLVALPAAASTFNIAPIRAELSAAHRTEVLTLMNADDEPVVVQVRLVAWSQQNGEERLDETREVLVTPPVLQIAPRGEQILRVALRREPDPVRELTYRVILEEVPQAAPVNFTGLRVALRLSVPIFVAPAHAKPVADVTWEARTAGDTVEVTAVNHGTRHLQVTDFDLDVAGAKGSLHGLTAKYVLPGSRMVWQLNASAAGPAVAGSRQGPIVIHGHSDQGEFSADVAFSGL